LLLLFVSSDQHDRVLKAVEYSLSKLKKIWHDVGITDGEPLRERYSHVHEHVNTLFSDMIAEETDHKQKLIDSVERHETSVRQLSRELGLLSTVMVCVSALHDFLMFVV